MMKSVILIVVCLYFLLYCASFAKFYFSRNLTTCLNCCQVVHDFFRFHVCRICSTFFIPDIVDMCCQLAL